MRLGSGSFSFAHSPTSTFGPLWKPRPECMAIIVQRRLFYNSFYRLLSLALHTNNLQFLYEGNSLRLEQLL
jgi:hypothetical protein